MGDRIGFVLAGGGTKGAFEVGALGHVVGRLGLVPDIVTAASAGSIIGAKLAQARGADEARARIDELTSDLLAMSDTEVVFGRRAWLEDLRSTEIGRRILEVIERRPEPASFDGRLPGDPDGDPDVPDPRAAAEGRRHQRLGSLRAVASLLGDLGAVDRARRDLPDSSCSFLTLDPLGRALRGGDADAAIAPLDVDLVARPGLDLRLAVTATEPGMLRFVCGDGTVVEDDARTPSPSHDGPVDLVEAVLTSSSAPLVFAPRQLGGRTYADGGILANLPVGAAVDLGATRVVAVVATTIDAPLDPRTAADMTLLDVHVRASELMFYDQQRRSLQVPEGVGLDVIAPTVDLVGAFEVNEGLLRIDMDYGWLRAQEALADIDEGTRALARLLTDRIAVARDRSWYAEELVMADRPGATLDDVRRLKEVVGETLDRRAALGLEPPPGASSWASTWEAHDESAAEGGPPPI